MAMRYSRWWIGVGAAAALLGGSARAGTTDGDDAAGGDPAAQPAPSVQEGEGATAQDPAHAPAKEGEPARTSADPGSGDVEIKARPQADPGAGSPPPPFKSDPEELDAGNSRGSG